MLSTFLILSIHRTKIAWKGLRMKAERTNNLTRRWTGPQPEARPGILPGLGNAITCPPSAIMSRPAIKDEFTRAKISRQRKYQLRMQRDGRCTECGKPVIQGSRCLMHLIRARERQRSKRHLQRRYFSTMSYRLQAESVAAIASKRWMVRN